MTKLTQPCCALSALTALLIPAAASAGSWTLPEETSLHIISYRYYSADQFYSVNGKSRDKDGTYRKHEIEHYYETGVKNWLTVGWSLAASQETDRQNTSFFNPATNQNEFVIREIELEGISRIEPFARIQLYKTDNSAVALQPAFKFASLYANELPAEAQADEWEAELALQAGHNFELLGYRHYIDTALGYRHRDGRLGNQYRAAFTLGTHINERLDVLGQLQHIEAASDINANFATLSGSNNFDLTKLQLSSVYEILPDVALQLGASKDVDGINTGRGSSVFSAIWLRF